MQSEHVGYFKDHGPNWVTDAYGDERSIAFDRLRLALETVHALKPHSIIDVGCGDGRFLRFLDQVEVRCGVDHSDKMLELARRSFSDASVTFGQFDLNLTDVSLSKFGRFDLVTMLGVIHYLSAPRHALENVRDACGNALLISFRNRLFNITEGSSYRSTALTVRDHISLEDESSFWKSSDGRIPEDQTHVLNRQTFEGVSDPGWNPKNHTHWRQFTPFDALTLLRIAGFAPRDIWPLNVDREDDPRQRHSQLPNSTSFAVLAAPI